MRLDSALGRECFIAPGRTVLFSFRQQVVALELKLRTDLSRKRLCQKQQLLMEKPRFMFTLSAFQCINVAQTYTNVSQNSLKSSRVSGRFRNILLCGIMLSAKIPSTTEAPFLRASFLWSRTRSWTPCCVRPPNICVPFQSSHSLKGKNRSVVASGVA